MSILQSREIARQGLSAKERCSTKLHVASERYMMDFLNDYQYVERFTDCRQLICNRLGVQFAGQPFNFLKSGLWIKDFRTCAVSHCYGAQAVSVTFENGFKFSYSGDCRPSEHFARMGRNSDVLVHEATFDDGLEGDARAKKHCTTGEALAVASSMKAKNVILTHFSQRYQKIPVIGDMKLPQQVKFEDETDSPDPVGVSTDEAMNSGPLLEQVGGEDLAKSIPIPNASSPKESQVPEGMTWLDALSQNAGWSSNSNKDTGDVVVNQDTATSHEKLRSTVGVEASPNVVKGSVNGIPPDMNVCVAFDFMRVRVSDIKHMHRFEPALTTLFASEHPEPISSTTTERDKNLVQNRKTSSGGEPMKTPLEDKGASGIGSDSGSETSNRQAKRARKTQLRKERKHALAEETKSRDGGTKAKMLKNKAALQSWKDGAQKSKDEASIRVMSALEVEERMPDAAEQQLGLH